MGENGWYINKEYNAPQNIMALLCQAKNFGWDKSLRDKINVMLLTSASISFLVLALYGIYFKSTLNDFLNYIVFMFPLFRYFLVQLQDNRKSIGRIERVKDFVDKEISNLKISDLISDIVLIIKFEPYKMKSFPIGQHVLQYQVFFNS